MPHEALVLLAAIVYCVIHSLLAMDRVKRFARRVAGERAYRWYRLAYSVFGTLSLLPIALLIASNPGAVLWEIPAPFVYATIAVQVFCLLAMAWVIWLVGAGDFIGFGAFRGQPTIAATGLVTGGAYRYVRHPLYSFAFALLWLTPAMTTSGLAVAVPFTVYVILGTYVEERRLLAEFGPTYALYRERTPRLIPWRKRGVATSDAVAAATGRVPVAGTSPRDKPE